MKKILLMPVIILCSFLILLTGCTSITSGTVIDKRYNEAYDSVWYWKTENFVIPQTRHHEAKYMLRLQEEQDGKIIDSWIYVSEETYNAYAIGDQYPKEES